MVSASNKPADIVAALLKGANDYVGKPINKDELLARMTTQLTICLSCRAQPGSSLSCKTCTTKNEVIQNDQFAFAPHHLVGVLDLLPFAFTIYDTDAKVILRNKPATEIFSALGGPPDAQNYFMPHAKFRHHANDIFTLAKNSSEVDETIPVVYGEKETNHRVSARLILVVNEATSAKVPFILVTESVIFETEQKETKEREAKEREAKEKEAKEKEAKEKEAKEKETKEKETPPKPVPQKTDQSTQTTARVASSNQNVPQLATTPRSVSPTHTRPRSTSPRGNIAASSLNLSPSSPRRNLNLTVVPPTTPGRASVSSPNPSSRSSLSASTTSNSSTASTVSVAASASTPNPQAVLNESSNLLNMEQVLDYVDTLHNYIGDLEKDKRARGEFVPNVVRSASLPSAFKQRGVTLRPALNPNSLPMFNNIPRLSLATTNQNLPSNLPKSHTTDNLAIPSALPNTPFLLPTPIPSPRGDFPVVLAASQDSPLSSTPSYFTRSSFNTPNTTPLTTSRSISSSDAPFFTLSSYSSLDSIPENLLHSRFLNTSTAIPQIPPDSISEQQYSGTPVTTPGALSYNSGTDPRILRSEIHELQSQIYIRQAQLASFLRIKFRITAVPSTPSNNSNNTHPITNANLKDRRFSVDTSSSHTSSSSTKENNISRERNNLLARFYSTLELPEANVRMLYGEVAHRLEVPVDSILALVKNGDTLITVDEDVEDGLTVDVFLDEQV